MFDIGKQRPPERSSAALVPDFGENISVFGTPLSSLRYSLAVSLVLVVVSAIFLSLTYY